MREISESEWDNRTAKHGDLKEFQELVNKKIKNDSYAFENIERATKETFRWLFHATSSYNQTNHATLINEKYQWLLQKKIIDHHKFFELMMTEGFYSTDEKLDIAVKEFETIKIPLKEKCRLIAKNDNLYWVTNFLAKACPNLQENSKKALFLNKAVAGALIKESKTSNEKSMFQMMDILNNLNFDFCQSFDGTSLMEAIIRKSFHPYIVLKIYPELPKDYRMALVPALTRSLNDLENNKIDYNFFLHEITKEKLIKEAFIIMESDIITPDKLPSKRFSQKL